jgi:hypothetical protein
MTELGQTVRWCSFLLLMHIAGLSPARAQAVPSQILVEDRPLPTAVARAHVHQGRLLLPLFPIAEELGDKVRLDTAAERISVQLSQTGEVRTFHARLGEIRKGGEVLGRVPHTAEIVVTERAEDQELPIDVLALLLDVSVQVNLQEDIVIIHRRVPKQLQHPMRERPLRGPTRLAFSNTPRWMGDHYRHDVHLAGQTQIQNDMLSGGLDFTVGDDRTSIAFSRGFISLQRPSGQLWTAGDYALGQAYKLIATSARGLSLEQPMGHHQLSLFGGAAVSQGQAKVGEFASPQFRTGIFGLLFSNRALLSGHGGFGYGFGLTHFSGPSRGGTLLVQQFNHSTRRNRLQIDSGFGAFRIGRESATGNGPDLGIDVSDFLRLGPHSFSFRAAHFGSRFSTPRLHAAYKDRDVLSARWSSQLTRGLRLGAGVDHKVRGSGRARNSSRTFSWSAAYKANRTYVPQISLQHTIVRQRLSALTRTQLSLSRALGNWRPTFSLSHVSRPGRKEDSAHFGSRIDFKQYGSLQVQQNFSTTGQYKGAVDWVSSPWREAQLQFRARLGYIHHSSRVGVPTRLTARASAWIRLSNQQILQFSFSETERGQEFRVTLGGFLLSGPAELNLVPGSGLGNIPASELRGRVYEDVNLNGRFDPKTDRPLAGIRLWLDGSTMVYTNAQGIYHYKAVPPGPHGVAVDQATIENDLVPLGGSNHILELPSQVVVVFDFRFARPRQVPGTV